MYIGGWGGGGSLYLAVPSFASLSSISLPMIDVCDLTFCTVIFIWSILWR